MLFHPYTTFKLYFLIVYKMWLGILKLKKWFDIENFDQTNSSQVSFKSKLPIEVHFVAFLETLLWLKLLLSLSLARWLDKIFYSKVSASHPDPTTNFFIFRMLPKKFLLFRLFSETKFFGGREERFKSQELASHRGHFFSPLHPPLKFQQ